MLTYGRGQLEGGLGAYEALYLDVELWILRYLSLLALLVHTKVQILTPEELLRR
jgi:hypothetical protein